MGNICCGYDEEAYKDGAWYGDDDTDDQQVHHNGAFNEGDNNYDDKAADREQLILLHEKQKRRISPPLSPLETDDTSSSGRGSGSESSDCRRNMLNRVKRAPIQSTRLVLPESYKPPFYPKTHDTVQFLLQALDDNFIFDSLDDSANMDFVHAMQLQEFKEGEWVMNQGDIGDYFYIIYDGEVAFHVDDADEEGEGSPPKREVGSGSKGSSFGELALLYSSPRQASVRALSPLILYKIDQQTFKLLHTSHEVKDRSCIISVFEALSIFGDLDEHQIQKLADATSIMEFDEGERIVNKGDEGNVMYIIKSGQVKVDDIGHGLSKFKAHILKDGECFGERALITNEARAANVTAVCKTLLMAISKGILEEILGPLDQAIMHSIHARYLQSIPLFEYLEPDEIDRCVIYLKEENFTKSEKIVSEGKLCLIQEGHALMMIRKNTKNGSEPKLIKLEKGDYFGNLWKGIDALETGQLPQDPTSDFSARNTVTVETDIMRCLTLLAEDVERVIGGDMDRLSVQSLDPVEDGGKPPQRPKMSRIKSSYMKSSSDDFIKGKRSYSNRDVMSLSKLQKHRILGVGTFGKVWLVTPKSNDKKDNKSIPFALKMVSKRNILKQQLVPAILREKNVLESIQHPFLLRMISKFQDENYLYFVLDLVLGGELFGLIYSDSKNKDSPEWKQSQLYKSFGMEDEKPIKGVSGLGVRKALFYSAGIIEAFAYLHNRRIVYRDLKPENVLLNSNGFCVIVDFGFAKVVVDKTYTMCGTPEYVSPEVIVSKGHNHTADYWSFGCLLYELVVGQTPFFDASLDQLSFMKKIVSAQYTFPQALEKLNPDDSNGLEKALCNWRDLVSRLLKPKSIERLGNLRNGIDGILHHEWFAEIDFNEFRSEKTPAPWIPTIVDPMDTSNFENKFADQPEFFRRKLSDKDQAIFSSF